MPVIRSAAVVSLLLVASSASGQTVLAGTVTDGTSLGGVIQVEDARVPAGATLDVLPGATLQFSSESRLVVDGTLVVGGDAERPVVLRGTTPDAAIRLGEGGAVRLEGARVDMEAGALVEGDRDLDVAMRSVEVEAGRFVSLLRGGQAGEVVFEVVRIVGVSFAGPVVDAPGAEVWGERVLLADIDVASPAFRAASVDLAFATLADWRADDLVVLAEAPWLRIETSVVWPGVAYVVAGPEAEIALSQSVVEGSWDEFLGVLTRSSGDGRSLFELNHDAPVFASDGSYRLASGTYGADLLPARQAADADGSRADLGAYGGGRRRLGTHVTVGIQTTLTEAAALPQQEGLRQDGAGFGASVLQEVSHRVAVSVGGRFYEADVSQTGLGSGRVSYLTGALGLIGQLRFFGPVTIETGPELLVHRWTYERSTSEGQGVMWRLNARIGAHAAVARGVGVRAGLDLPVLPATWNESFDIPGSLGSTIVPSRRAFVPRVHLGVSVRVR